MKEYTVTVKYTAFATLTVEARDQNEAEEMAWREIATDAEHYTSYGEWVTESVEENEEA